MQRIDPMRDFRDAKAMAQTLREALKTKSVSLTHSESLELVARILGFHDWNVLSATIQSEVQPAGNPGSTIPATVKLTAENQLPTVPLRDIVVFPHLNVPLFAGRAKTIHAVECAMAKDRRILVVTQRRPGDDNPTAADLYGVGLTASVTELMKLHDGTIKLLVKTFTRATIVRLVEDPFLTAEIAPLDESRVRTKRRSPSRARCWRRSYAHAMSARSASFTTDCRRAKSRAHWQMPSPLSSRATSDRSKTFWRPVMWSRGCKRFSL
jgi:uncharacterized protein